MDASIIAAAAGATGVVVSKLIDLGISKNKSKPAELSLMSKRLETVDGNILQQRQQFDESTAKFRMELQSQINSLQAEIDELTKDNQKLRGENIALTFKVAELEYKLKLSDGSLGKVPSSITTSVTTATTTAVIDTEADTQDIKDTQDTKNESRTA